MRHLLVQWRTAAGDSRVQEVFDRVHKPRRDGAMDYDLPKRDRPWDETLDQALTYWRGSFMASSNIRAYIEGRPVAPAYQGDFWLTFNAEIIKVALATAPALGRETWRIEAGVPTAGQTLYWPIKAVAASRRLAEEYRRTLMLNEATMYALPDSARGVWYPDRMEAIVSGSFRVESLEAGEAGLAKTALPSWRPYQNDRTFWDEHDAVIATDKAGSRRTFEIWVDGRPFGRGQTLREAKDRVEAKLGPLTWRTERPPREEIVHYYFGPTTEFAEPLTLYWADREAPT